MMTLNEYQVSARVTAIYPDRNRIGGLLYTSLGLAGETGEFCDKVKKVLRDSDGVVTPERSDALKRELGDVLWYLSQCACELDYSLEDIARENLAKLGLRKEQGKLKGDGDNR